MAPGGVAYLGQPLGVGKLGHRHHGHLDRGGVAVGRRDDAIRRDLDLGQAADGGAILGQLIDFKWRGVLGHGAELELDILSAIRAVGDDARPRSPQCHRLDDRRDGGGVHLAGGIEGHAGAQGCLADAGRHGGGRTARHVDRLVPLIEVHAPGGRHRRLGRVGRVGFFDEVLGDGVRLPQGVIHHDRGRGGVSGRVLGIELGGIAGTIARRQRGGGGGQVEAGIDLGGLDRFAGPIRDLDRLGRIDADRLGGAVGVGLVALQVTP
ncbi:hypothetical protein D3C79_739360 [compost metagenome]